MIVRIRPLDQSATTWICKNIGPMKYYLHHKMGGDKWQYNHRTNELFVEDSKQLTMLLLKFPLDVQP